MQIMLVSIVCCRFHDVIAMAILGVSAVPSHAATDIPRQHASKQRSISDPNLIQRAGAPAIATAA
jgi:hypothetical protein